MFRSLKIKLIALIILFSFTTLIFATSIVTSQEDPFSEIKSKMDGISEKERETIQTLFIHAQKVEEMEMEEKRISGNIEALKKDISDLQNTIAEEEVFYAKRKETLKQVLSSYQRMGAGSYLEILLESDDLPDLLMRINTLRDLTRNTGTLMAEIQKSKDKQLEEKNVLSKKLALIEEERKQLVQALDKNKQVKAEMESYLVSLAGERGHYQDYLDNIQEVWGEIKPLFSKAISEVSDFIENGSLPEDALKISFNMFSFKVTMDAKALNDIIKANPQLPEIIFIFHQGKVEIKVPEKNLILEGKFVIVDGNSIKFEAEKGSFYGLPLEAGAIKGLFQDGYLVLDFKSKLMGFKMNSIEIKDEFLNISLKMD